MKRVSGPLLIVATILSLFVFAIPSAFAQSVQATMLLNPKNQDVTLPNDVTVKIDLKASATVKVSSARVLFKFDPSVLEIKEITTSSLFCQYPTDSNSYASDNTQGVVMVTGISSGTSACPYPELSGTAQTFVTVVFKTKKSGTSNLEFVFQSGNLNQSSYVVDTNSPTQFILTQPDNGSINVTEAPVVTTTTPPAPPKNLGIETDILAVSALAMLLVGGIFILTRKQHSQESRIIVREE